MSNPRGFQPPWGAKPAVTDTTTQLIFPKVVAAGFTIKYVREFVQKFNRGITRVIIKMLLTKILRPACIKAPLDGKDKTAVIEELVNSLDTNGLLLDKTAVLDAVLMREKTRSTGIGSGIAVPHGKCKAVKELVMAIGIAHEPVDFQSVDGKPVTIVILLVSPADQTGPHIQALAQISRLMLDEKFKKQLESAGTAEEVYQLLNSKENG